MPQFRVLRGLPPADPRWIHCFTRLAVGAIVVVCGLSRPVEGQPAPTLGKWSELIVPGGRAGVSKILNLDPNVERTRFVLEATRAIYDAPWGSTENQSARLGRLIRYLETVDRVSVQSESAPLPLDATTWSRVVLNRTVPNDRLFSAIIRDRRAALLYYGLMALEPETIAYLEGHPRVLEGVYRSASAAFSVFGRALRVAGGAIEVPGGQRARPLWEALVGESVARPDRFIPFLLERNDGRLAYFFDAVAHLDEPRQAFVFGWWMTDAGVRERRFRDLYRALAAADPAWKIPERPFSRSSHDAAMLLGQVLVESSGTPQAPNWRSLWELAFDSDGSLEPSERLLAEIDRGGILDAAWLVEHICLAEPEVRAARFDAFLFGQRVFRHSARDRLPDVVVALRAFPRFRSLALALERIGSTNPTVVANAARHAARLADLGLGDKAVVGLTQFQGAVAVVERMRLRRTLDVEAAERLIGRLTAARLSGDRYSGAIGVWLSDALLPEIAFRGQAADESVEGAVLAAMAGRETPDGRTFSWEGVSYRAAPAATALARMKQLKEGGKGNTLDTALHLSRTLAEIKGSVAPAARIRDARVQLEECLTAVAEIPAIGLHVLGSDDTAARARRDALDRLRRFSAGDSGDTRELLDRLNWLTDLSIAESLLRLTYAGALGSMGVSDSEAAELWRVHDFGQGAVIGEQRVASSWRVPRDTIGGGGPARIAGALLGLDLGMARMALRRMVSEPPQHPPVLNVNLRDAFTENVVMLNPFDLRDDDRDLIAAAIEGGLQRITALAGDASALEALGREIRLDEWRRQAIPWITVHEPHRLAAMFSRLELFWLGRQSEDLPPSLNAWGTPGRPVTGCPCLQFPRPQGFEEFEGRPMSGQLASRIPDLILRTAEVLARHKLPAPMARDVLAVATQDLVDQVQPAYSDDWTALVRYVDALPDERLQDYVSSAAAHGQLVAVSEVDSRSDAR